MGTQFFVLLFLLQGSLAVIYVQPNMKSFSSAIKNGYIFANQEKVLYEHHTGEPGVITEQWVTGYKEMMRHTRIRIYIDGEVDASLDFNLLLAHGFAGFPEKDDLTYFPKLPWGTSTIGHTAADGGIYNTFRIPFSKSFRVTATTQGSGYIWYIIRGVENYPLVLGDLVLPPHTRLRLYKNENFRLKPLDFMNLAYVKSSAGALFMVTLVAESSNLVFLEGCFRAYIDGSNRTTWLSSGTEDFFLSAFYFNRGLYNLSNAGLTYKSAGSIAAYKFFVNDPVLFTKSFELWWRCSDKDISGDKYGCPNSWPDTTPPRSEKFFENYAAMKDELYKGWSRLSKEELNKELSSMDEIQLKYKIAKEGVEAYLPPMYPTNVTTYTWVYEW